MRSHIRLLLQQLVTVDLSFDKLCELSKFPLKMSNAISIAISEGAVLIQSFSHHFVHIRLYEYNVNNHCMVDIEVTEPSFFLMAMLEGCSILYNEAGEAISEIFGNSCQLSYLTTGKYQRSLLSGDHKILLLTIRPDWLSKRYGDQEELKELINRFTSGAQQNYILPNFNIGQHIFNALCKFNVGTDIDIDIHVFLNDCIRRYRNKLHTKISNAEYRRNKAKEIGNFIIQNFANKIVDDEPTLARQFMVSTKTLTRLGKLHFGMTLHKQVMELRLVHAFKLLIGTRKTIQEIASSVGYDDPHYFSRAFKKRFGVRPNEVRLAVL